MEIDIGGVSVCMDVQQKVPITVFLIRKDKGGFMKFKCVLTLTLLGLLVVSSPSFAQNFFMNKDLLFGQVACGGGYESVINATNRGTATYNGTLYFFTGNGLPWNPMVNGVLVTNGYMDIAIPAGATRSYHITVTTAYVQAGMAFFYSDDLLNNNFLEGTLTYFVRSGSVVTDSIGVLPSHEFYLAAIPFEDFSSIALALNNGDPFPTDTANLTLTLYDENNSIRGTTALAIGSAAHVVGYLNQAPFFPGVSLGRGRLEIVTSEFPIFGTALTYTGSQASALPLVGSPRSYTFTTSTPSAGITTAGDASLWVDGFFVRGYIRFTTLNYSTLSPTETYFVAGRMIGTTLRLGFYLDSTGSVSGGVEANAYGRITGFTFSTNNLTNMPFVVTWVDPLVTSGSYPYGTTRTGTISLTRTN
jgi:hypothetical protein